MFTGICSGVNCKRLVPAILAVLAVIFISNYFIHGKLLEGAYQATANIWRTDTEMKSHCAWMFLGQALIAVFFTLIFAKGHEGKGLMEGVRFGLLIGLFYVGHFFIQYVTTPIPRSLLMAWVTLGMIQMILAGIVASLVYKK